MVDGKENGSVSEERVAMRASEKVPTSIVGNVEGWHWDIYNQPLTDDDTNKFEAHLFKGGRVVICHYAEWPIGEEDLALILRALEGAAV